MLHASKSLLLLLSWLPLFSACQQKKVEYPISVLPTTTTPSIGPDAIGHGFDVFNTAVRAACVEGGRKSIDTPSSNPTMSGGMDLTKSAISRRETLRDWSKLDVNASLGLGSFSGSFEGSFASLREARSGELSIVMRLVSDLQQATVLTDPQLTKDAYDAYKRGRAAFEQKCGQVFVEGFQLGGRIDFYQSIAFENLVEREDARAKLTAAVQAWGSALAEKVSSVTKTRAVDRNSFEIHQIGGGDRLLNADSIASLVYAFPAAVRKAPAILYYRLRPYSQLQGSSANLNPANLPDRNSDWSTFQELAFIYDTVTAQLNTARVGLQFSPNDFALDSLKQRVERKRSSVEDRIKACREGKRCELGNTDRIVGIDYAVPIANGLEASVCLLQPDSTDLIVMLTKSPVPGGPGFRVVRRKAPSDTVAASSIDLVVQPHQAVRGVVVEGRGDGNLLMRRTDNQTVAASFFATLCDGQVLTMTPKQLFGHRGFELRNASGK